MRAALAALLALLLPLLAYTAWGNWQLAHGLNELASNAGCRLSYRGAYTLLPGRMYVQRLKLDECEDGYWSLHAESLRGRFEPAALIWGNGFELSTLEGTLNRVGLGGAALEGQVLVHASRVRFGDHVPHVRSLTLKLGDGRLRLSNGALLRARDARGHVKFEAGRLRGKVVLKGDDAALLLELVQAPPGLRLALGVLAGVPFELGSDVIYEGKQLKLEQATFESESIRGRGHFTIDRQGATGRALLQYGSVRAGLELSNSGVTTKFDAPADWL